MPKQLMNQVHLASDTELMAELSKLITTGHEIQIVVPTSSHVYPDMNSVARADYLIIYCMTIEVRIKG